MTLSLGIDIGTSGIRTAVVDDSGAVVSTARANHEPQPGTGIDAELWWTATLTCLRRQVDALHTIGLSAGEISAIAVDGTSGSMVAVDAQGVPAGPALMYNSKGFDAEARLVEQHAPSPHITRGSNSALARAMRLVGDATRPPAHIVHQADFINTRLSGRLGISDHNNALKTGFDPATGNWPDWIDAVIDRALLPDVVSVGTPIGTLKTDLAQTLGLGSKVTVKAGTTDSIAAFLACTPPVAGVGVTSLGSTLAVKILSKTRIDDPEIGLYSHRIGEGWLVGGASNTGGAVLAHFFDPSELDRLSAQLDPAKPLALDYYPLLQAGERFPINDPDFEPRLTPRPDDDAEFLHGLFEGIAEIERRCYREIEARGGSYPTLIYSAGGGAKNDTYTAIRQRVLGTRIALPKHMEASVGAASIGHWDV